MLRRNVANTHPVLNCVVGLELRRNRAARPPTGRPNIVRLYEKEKKAMTEEQITPYAEAVLS